MHIRADGIHGLTERQEMALTGFVRAAAVTAAVAAAGFGLAAPSASAATQTAHSAVSYWDGSKVEAQVDNNPGSGSASWLWIADYDKTDVWGAVAHVNFVDGSSATYGEIRNGSQSTGLSKDVRSFEVCFHSGATTRNCSGWVYP